MGLADDGQDDTHKARLDALSHALDAHRKGTASKPTAAEPSSSTGVGQAVSLGARVMSELVAAVVVGAVIGWAIDHALGSSPVALIIFMALGTVAGFWNVYRVAAKPTGSSGGSA